MNRNVYLVRQSTRSRGAYRNDTRRTRDQRIAAIFCDPLVTFETVDRSSLSYIRSASKAVSKVLSAIDSPFGMVLGATIIVGFLCRRFLGSSLGIRARDMVEAVAGFIATTIFTTTVLRAAFDTHSAHAIEGKVRNFIASLQTRLQLRSRFLPPPLEFLVSFNDLPEGFKDAAVAAMAQMAFNRWTGNATYDERRNFFLCLSRRYPQGIRLGLEYNNRTRKLSLYGYAALVPLSIESYRRHLLGEVNLFSQRAEFLLDHRDVVARIAAYNRRRPIDLEKEGLAVYILGMNVRAGTEHTQGKRMALTLRKQVRDFLRLFPAAKPYLYCATTIPSVMKLIHRNGFVHNGHREVNGNLLYERNPS